MDELISDLQDKALEEKTQLFHSKLSTINRHLGTIDIFPETLLKAEKDHDGKIR